VIGRIGLTLLALTIVSSVYLAWKGPAFLVQTATDVLQKAGLPKVNFTVSRITLSDVTLEGIRVGGDTLEIPRLSAVFTWRELFDAEVGELSIDGLRLTASVTPDGLSFGELDKFFFADRTVSAAPAAGPTLDWPFRRITLQSARVDIQENDAVRLRLTVDGDVARRPDGGLAIGPATVTAQNTEIDITSGVTASITPSGLLTAKLALTNGSMTYQGIAAKARLGEISLTLPLQDLTAAEATGNLDVALDALPFGLSPVAGLSLTYSQGFLLADLSVLDQGSGLSANIQTTADLSQEPTRQTVAVDASFAATDAARLPTGLLPFRFSSGDARAQVSVSAPMGQLQKIAQAEDLKMLFQAAPDLRIGLYGDGLESPLFPGTLSLASSFSLAPSPDGSLSLTLSEEATLRITPTDASLWDALIGIARQDGPVSPLTLTVSKTEGPLLAASLTGNSAKVRFNGSFRTDGGGLPTVHGAAKGNANLDLETGIERAELEALTLNAPHLSALGIRFSDLEVSADGKGTAATAEGAITLRAALASLPPAPAVLAGGSVDLPMTWEFREGRLALDGGACPSLAFQRVAYAGLTVQAPQARFCLTPFALRVDRAPQGAGATLPQIGLKAGLQHQEGPILVALPEQHRLKIDTGGDSFAVHLQGDPDAIHQFDADLALAKVLAPTVPADLKDIHIRISQPAASAAIALETKLDIKDLARPARFGPVSLSSDATIMLGGGVEAQGRLSLGREPDPISLEWEAGHDLSNGSGRMTARLPPFRFSARDSRLITAIPLFEPYLSSAAGQLLGAVSADWKDDRGCARGDSLVRSLRAELTGTSPLPAAGIVQAAQLGLSGEVCVDAGAISRQRGQVLVENLSLSTEQVTAKAMNAVIDVRSMAPLRTEPAQLVSIGVIDVGFPLTDGIAEFEIDEPEKFTLHRLGFDWVGGTVQVDPVSVAFDDLPERLDLRLKGLQIAELTKLLPDAGISGEGSLQGHIPLFFEADGPAVRDGYLSSTTGVIRYQPKAAIGEEAGVVDDALSNLQYSDLRLDLEGGLKGGAAIALHLEGRNPDYYDGVPVVLDLNLTGPVGSMMNDGLAAYRVPAQIVERMRRFGQFE